MDQKIKEQVLFVLEDDNEVMTAALDSDLDKVNKDMNHQLIREHEKIIDKVEQGKKLTQHDLDLIRDANQIHLNDVDNLAEHYQQALKLNEWLENRIELSVKEATEILEGYLDKNLKCPTKVYRALHTLWEESTPNDIVTGPPFDDQGKCLKCGSKLSLADATDTLVFVCDDIVKRHDGDIINRNCMKCNYPEIYADYKYYDEE